ncbi:MAG TPA: pantoate--beta-alanine ligase [Ohtaekwangia sp.]|nr:pantoate--beta-alanine ligase [Ohtaekwangia sp.]
MVIFNEIAPLKAFLKEKKQAGKSIGLVPTMGALHAGHLSIIDVSRRDNDVTVCSIYVNPTQFNNASDLRLYPRTLDKDTKSLEKVECDVLFYPNNDEMYKAPSLLKFDFAHLDKVMEGQFRPGHFSGVALVVSKLFNIVEPDNAYFGQKDWQQFTVISQLTEELKFNLQLHSIPTLREADGLAMSSRNLRLNNVQRQSAIFFYTALNAAKKAFHAGQSVAEVKSMIESLASSHDDVRLEYFEIADSKNLNVLENVKAANRPIMCIAGFVGEVRLIDNMFID